MNEKIYIYVGKNIKKYRKKRGLSLKELSNLTNLDQKYLKNIEEKGVDGNITFYILNNFCDILNIPIKDLFDYNVDNSNIDIDSK